MDSGAQTAGSSSPSRARRELLLIVAALFIGLLVIPLLIWIVGHWTLGPYTHGDSGPAYGPLTLYGDYFTSLSRGNPGFWAVALGPLVLLCAARLWLSLMRYRPRN